MNHERLLPRMIGLTLVLIFAAACGAVQPTPSASPTPTESPAPTPTSVPGVRGSLIDADTDEPLVGARVILCAEDSETSCCMDGDHSSVTDGQGEFEIQVPGSGDYVVFYNLSGDMRPGWDGLCLDYAVPSMSMGLREDLQPLLASLGGGSLSLCAQVWAGAEGWATNLYSGTQDLGVVWMWDEPVSVTVANGVGEIHLAVWNVASESCGDEFRPIR